MNIKKILIVCIGFFFVIILFQLITHLSIYNKYRYNNIQKTNYSLKSVESSILQLNSEFDLIYFNSDVQISDIDNDNTDELLFISTNGLQSNIYTVIYDIDKQSVKKCDIPYFPSYRAESFSQVTKVGDEFYVTFLVHVKKENIPSSDVETLLYSLNPVNCEVLLDKKIDYEPGLYDIQDFSVKMINNRIYLKLEQMEFIYSDYKNKLQDYNTPVSLISVDEVTNLKYSYMPRKKPLNSELNWTKEVAKTPRVLKGTVSYYQGTLDYNNDGEFEYIYKIHKYKSLGMYSYESMYVLVSNEGDKILGKHYIKHPTSFIISGDFDGKKGFMIADDQLKDKNMQFIEFLK